MANLAKWLATQRAGRVVFIAGLFPLPGLGLFSAATVVMAAQLHGPREALQDCLLALLLLAGIAWLTGMDTVIVAASAAVSWSVWLALGALAGRSGSLQLALQSALLLALLALGLLWVLVEDPVAYWSAILDMVYKDLSDQGIAVEADIAQQAALMSGLVIAGSFVGSVVALLLGSAWASAVRKGNYAGQFRELRLGYVIGGLATIAGLAELAGLNTGGVLMIFGAAFMFHGMAVVAWWAAVLTWPRGWWLGLCILGILLPDLLMTGLVLFAAIGFIDNCYSLRRKLA